MIKSGKMQTTWLQINENMITSPAIQRIKILDGEHYLHHNQADKIANITKEFLSDI